MRRLPSLTALRAFECAARHGHFGRVADELNVTDSAISHQVRQLEEQLGTTLFVRQGRHMRPTPQAGVCCTACSRSSGCWAQRDCWRRWSSTPPSTLACGDSHRPWPTPCSPVHPALLTQLPPRHQRHVIEEQPEQL